MKSADEIFRRFPEAAEVLTELRVSNREAYRAAASVLATRRKLRVVFLDKKPLPERHAWMAAELGRPSNNDVATEILQGWLLGSRKPMLLGFLDALGVKHDGEGLIESLPDEPPRGKLDAALEGILAGNPAWAVAAYLSLFCQMDIAKWPTLAQIVESDTRLQPKAP